MLPVNYHTKLTCRHNAGFFSCCTIALIEVIKYFNKHRELPAEFDRSTQFAFYKPDPAGPDLTPLLFAKNDLQIPYTGEIVVTNEPGEVSFGDYGKFHFNEIALFVEKYFSPSPTVLGIMRNMKLKYELDYENTCAVFYRGNDKQMECDVTPYADFIDTAKEVLDGNQGIKFLLLPDETQMYETFTKAFPDNTICMDETPHMQKKNSAIFYELRGESKVEHATNFLAAVMTVSRCKYVIQSKGNGAMWVALYRDGVDGVHTFNNKHKV